MALNRRTFLKTTAAATALPTVFPGWVHGQAPNNKLNIAGIGVNNMGFTNLRNVKSQNIVAICDVDHRLAGKTFKRFPNAKRWRDYRAMLDKQKDIDAVMIATPDHTHANIALAAMQAGKHVYCQKPLTQDVYEARVLTRAAARAGVTTQMGNQYHSSAGIRLCREWVQAGVLGNVREVDAWSSLRYEPWGHAWWAPLMGHPPKKFPKKPDRLAWDLWLGRAEHHRYHPTYHPGRWRAWWAFGSGMMGDRGVHTLDSVFWALDLDAPNKIEVIEKSETHPVLYPSKVHIRFHFPKRGNMPPVVVNWYSGMTPPRPKLLPKGQRLGDPGGGVMMHGEDGILMHGVYPRSPYLYPEALIERAKQVPRSIPRVQARNHEMNWVNAAKAGEAATSDFSYSGPLTEFCVLGNVATRIGGSMQWDPKQMRSTNRPEAAPWIRRPRRDGWALES
jgi:predicted dehydrogenase